MKYTNAEIYPNISFLKRIRQLFCKHETAAKWLVIQGMNGESGNNYVSYMCRKCDHSFQRWERDSETGWDYKQSSVQADK